jgi:hypothetical protein
MIRPRSIRFLTKYRGTLVPSLVEMLEMVAKTRAVNGIVDDPDAFVGGFKPAARTINEAGSL